MIQFFFIILLGFMGLLIVSYLISIAICLINKKECARFHRELKDNMKKTYEDNMLKKVYRE